jgi:DNA-binding winged helix-turn-helix (wHTH) protein/tetratricopeptide (TPR) repeat protein
VGRVYRSGAVEFDVESAMLRGSGGSQPLRKQVARTLELLMSRAPALVPTDEILTAVWGRHAISPSAVPQAIRELRRALGDEAQHPRYVETRHRLGYRWIEPVMIVDEVAGSGRVEGAGVDPAVLATASPRTDDAPGCSGLAALEVTGLVPKPPAASLRDRPASVAAGPASAPQRAFWVLPLAIALVLMLLVGLYVAGPAPTPSRADSISLPTDPRWPAIRDAFLEYRLDAAGESLADLTENAAAVPALRARIAILRADGEAAAAGLRDARAALDPQDRAGALWVDTLEAHAAGRDIEAWTTIEPLLALRPDDPDVLLAAWELRRKAPADRLDALASAIESADGIPLARRALLAAQVAGVRKDAAMQREQALHAIKVHGAQHPPIAALARLELAAAAAALRDAALAEVTAAEASVALESLGVRRAAIRAAGDAAWHSLLQDRLDAAEAGLARMQRLLARHHDPAGAIVMQHYRALLLRRRGESARAVEAFVALAAEYEALGDFRSAANALNSSVEPRYLIGRADEVPAVLERAIVLARRGEAQDTLGYLHGTLGNHYVRTGNLELGHDALTLAMQAFQGAGDRPAEATALGNLGEVAVMRGRLDDAVGYIQRSREINRDLDRKSGIGYADLRLARILAARGDLAGAVEAGTQAAGGFAELGIRKEEATARRHLGVLHLRRAEPVRAREEARALDAIDDAGALVQAERAYLTAALAHHEGAFDGAHRQAEVAAEHWRGANQPIDAAMADALALRARLALGDRVAVEEEARSLLKQPVAAESPVLRRVVGLILAEAMLAGPSRSGAAGVLDEVDATLPRAPDAEDELRAVLLRARLDEDRTAQRERLAWVVAEAEARKLALPAIEAQGELAALEGPGALAAWRRTNSERAPGLVRRRMVGGP